MSDATQGGVSADPESVSTPNENETPNEQLQEQQPAPVSPDEDPGSDAPQQSARERTFKDIVAASRAARDRDLAEERERIAAEGETEPGADGGEGDGEGEPAPSGDEDGQPRDAQGRFTKQEDETPASPAEGDAPATPGEQAEPQLVTINVNGQDRQVTLNDALRAANRVFAASEQFQRFAEWRRGIEEQIRANGGDPDAYDLSFKGATATSPGPTAPTTEQPQPGTSPTPTPAPLNAEPSKEQMLDLARKIQYGTDEEAAEVLAELLAPQKQAVDQTQISNQVRAQIAIENWRQENDTALTSFNQNYPDIAGNEQLGWLAGKYTLKIRADELTAVGYDASKMSEREVLAAHQQLQVRGTAGISRQQEVFAKAGDAIRAMNAGQLTGKKTETQQTSTDGGRRQAALETKRAAPTPPAAMSRNKPAAKPTTLRSGSGGSDTVGWMARSRGQRAG